MKYCMRSYPFLSTQPYLFSLKIVSVGANPSDHMHIDASSKPGDWLGTDFVGQVVELGLDVPKDKVKIGELRWNYCRGGLGGKGAFAE